MISHDLKTGKFKKYKINVMSNSSLLTYNQCTILHEDDNSFIRFTDKFGVEFYYNKNNVISLEVVENG